MSLRDKLDRLLGPAVASDDRARVEQAMRRSRARADIAEVVPGEEVADGAFLVRRDHEVPAEFAEADARWWASLAREPAFAGVQRDAVPS